MPSVRTVFGGTITRTPVVSYAIIGACVVVYIFQLSLAGFTAHIEFVPALGKAEPWRFISAAFAHSPSQITHIVFNMLALWLVGAQYVERLLGGVRYAAVYLISALGGSVVYLLLAQPPSRADAAVGDWGAWGTATVGASGAVFGLFGAFLVLNRHLGRSSAGMYATILINAVIGFVVPGIAWQAHLGGILTGAAAAYVIARTSAKERRRLQWPGLALLVVLLVVLALAKYAIVPAWAVVG
jgi:membrane associated rhomboid family serine protease